MNTPPLKIFDNSSHLEKFSQITCDVPFTDLHIYDSGDVGNCCFTWLPTYIGNVKEQTLLQMLQGQISKQICNSVSDGTFSHCDPTLCPKLGEYLHLGHIKHPLLPIEDIKTINPKKLHIYLSYDVSCNLYCGSCRHERILYTEETAPEEIKFIHRRVLEQINELLEHGYELTLNITGSGDPFASPLYWKFMHDIGPDSSLKLELSTNGTLMTRERLLLPYAQKLKFIGISIDAASEETYKKVRRGGSFKALVNNIENLNAMVKNRELKASWRVNFVVQDENYKEMADFAHWALGFETITEVWYNSVAQWRHMDDDYFMQKAVWHKNHPRNEDFKRVLENQIFNHPKILLGNVAQFRNSNE